MRESSKICLDNQIYLFVVFILKLIQFSLQFIILNSLVIELIIQKGICTKT